MKKNYIFLFVLFMHMFAVQATTIYAYRSFQRDAGSTASVRGPVKFDTSNPRAISLIANYSRTQQHVITPSQTIHQHLI